ncbi:MAG: hypothetical protein R3B68_01825 [Phycisphaerales bacterium]
MSSIASELLEALRLANTAATRRADRVRRARVLAHLTWPGRAVLAPRLGRPLTFNHIVVKVPLDDAARHSIEAQVIEQLDALATPAMGEPVEWEGPWGMPTRGWSGALRVEQGDYELTVVFSARPELTLDTEWFAGLFEIVLRPARARLHALHVTIDWIGSRSRLRSLRLAAEAGHVVSAGRGVPLSTGSELDSLLLGGQQSERRAVVSHSRPRGRSLSWQAMFTSGAARAIGPQIRDSTDFRRTVVELAADIVDFVEIDSTGTRVRSPWWVAQRSQLISAGLGRTRNPARHRQSQD